MVPITRLINSVGTIAFVKYYDDFKSKTREELVEIFIRNNEEWIDTGRNQVANNGKRIFRENREIEALEHIIINANPNIVGENTIQRAKELYEKESNGLDSIELINEISKLGTLNPTEKDVITKYRLQQSKYRLNLLEYWKGCSVTRCSNPKLLIASHIKKYSKCENNEKYDPKNGLLLTPALDKLFDQYLITFDNNGKIIIPKDLECDLLTVGIHKEMELNSTKLTEGHQVYLEWQRTKFNENNN